MITTSTGIATNGSIGYYATRTLTRGFTCNNTRYDLCCYIRHITMPTTTTTTGSSSVHVPGVDNNTDGSTTDASLTSNVAKSQYSSFKLIVAYDGTRFHGFQRQIDNDTLMKQYHDKKLLASLRPKKRPHYHDIDVMCSGSNDGEIPRIRKGCNISVQEVLEFVLLDMYNQSPTTSTSSSSALTVQDISLTFAGRTDKGVHANGQVCLVHLPTNNNDTISDTTDIPHPSSTTSHSIQGETTSTSYYDYDCWKLRNDMNSRLPLDISIQHVSRVPNHTNHTTFDPRRDVTLKTYTYTIRYRRCPTQRSSSTNGNQLDDEKELQRMIEQSGGPHSIRNATDTYCLWIVPWMLCHDDTILPNLCQQFVGNTRNFYYFIHKADRDNPKKSTMHTIHEMSYEVTHLTTEYITSSSSSSQQQRQPNIIVSSEIVTGRFTFIAKSFRRTMIRNIVGYCIDACRPPNEDNNNVLLPSIESLLARRKDDPLQHTTNHNNDGDKEESTLPYIINAAPASGLCLESVSY